LQQFDYARVFGPEGCNPFVLHPVDCLLVLSTTGRARCYDLGPCSCSFEQVLDCAFNN
jgi:hypothetical protein